MSMHKVPLIKIEEEGLKAHHLPIGKPSQLADAFRHGIAWAINKQCEPMFKNITDAFDPLSKTVITEGQALERINKAIYKVSFDGENKQDG
jgi:hypothetical protein